MLVEVKEERERSLQWVLMWQIFVAILQIVMAIVCLLVQVIAAEPHDFALDTTLRR